MDLQKVVDDLSNEEKVELIRLLSKDLKELEQPERIKAQINQEQVILCPHCDSSDLYGHGMYKGRKRYQCKSCRKTFNDFTGTAISGIKKTEKFQKFIGMIPERYSIRKAAAKLEVNVKTIFDWRHKILSSLKVNNGQSFSGIVECDDKQLVISYKGSRKLEREPYKRPSDRKTKRGISNDKISVMVATDRKGNPTMQVAKIGRVDSISIENVMGNFIKKENVLCSDSNPSIIAWAKEKRLEHHTFVASKHQHVKDKCYHIQHVNSMDNLYERWVKQYYGVATKYLEQYLNLFIFTEKSKKSKDPIVDLIKNIVSNMQAQRHYHEIEERFEKLGILQYS